MSGRGPGHGSGEEGHGDLAGLMVTSVVDSGPLSGSGSLSVSSESVLTSEDISSSEENSEKQIM